MLGQQTAVLRAVIVSAFVEHARPLAVDTS